MNSLTRQSVTLTVVPLAVMCAVGTIFLASAQPLSTVDPEICATPISDVGAEASFLAENAAAMKKMMSGMAVKPTGDVVDVAVEALVEPIWDEPQLIRGRRIRLRVDQTAIHHGLGDDALTVDRLDLCGLCQRRTGECGGSQQRRGSERWRLD